KSNIPVIVRPRSMNQETFSQYMDSTRTNVAYRITELENLHADGKCPHKAIQHLRSLEKELEYMSKRFAPLIKRRRQQADKSNNILMKKCQVSEKLAKFLKLGKGEQVSRSEVNLAVTTYINVRDLENLKPGQKKWVDRLNPNGKRSLQGENHSVIEPDDPLSALLDYPAYKKRVTAGKQFWNRKNKETGVRERVKETNPQLTYSVVQHLLAVHFPKSDASAAPAAKTAAPRTSRKTTSPVAAVESDAEDDAVDSEASE
ncbi:MAG: hypothetical protein ABJA64_02730, partial [Candidatus Saccharibacteria bacterium]